MPTILITGAGRGLGLELARQYAQDGWRVVGTARASAPELGATGARVLELEVTDFPATKRITQALNGEAIDLLFCNAGIIGRRGMALGRFDYAEWEKVLRVNLRSSARPR